MKTIFRSSPILASVLVFALSWNSSAFAGTLRVDDDKVECPEAGFNTIQAAVDAAMSGDTIEVCTGTYDEQVEIAKPLSLVGIKRDLHRDGKNAAVVRPSNVVANADFLGTPNASAIIVRDTSGVTIRNITIDGIKNGVVCGPDSPFLQGIFFKNASGELDSVVIKNLLSPEGCAFGDGLDVLGTEGGALHITVKNSSIHDYDATGILSFGAGVTLSAIKNVVTGLGGSAFEGQTGIALQEGANRSIEENIVTNHFNPDYPNRLFFSFNIAFSSIHDTRVVGNVIGHGNFGIYGGANRVSFLDNTVFDTDEQGILVLGGDNVIKNNRITNSNVALLVSGANNTIQDNTINEAKFGLLLTKGNNVMANQFSNTRRTKRVFK